MMVQQKRSFPTVKIRASFVLYCAALLLIDGPVLLACVLFTLFVHEAAHLFSGYLLHESFSSLELTPFGGMISCNSAQSRTKGIRGILIAGAGPAANYALLSFACHIPALIGLEDAFLKTLISVNASMLLLNLLPVLPLDGGRIVFSIGYYLFPIEVFLTLLSALGRIVGGLFVVLALIGSMKYGTLNFSLIVVGIYIFLYSENERNALLIDNRYAVLQEKLGKASSLAPVRVYLVQQEEPLLNLLPNFFKKDVGVYMISYNANTHFITEENLISAFLKDPHCTAGESIFPVLSTDETF